jgi:hypothetical protein
MEEALLLENHPGRGVVAAWGRTAGDDERAMTVGIWPVAELRVLVRLRGNSKRL